CGKHHNGNDRHGDLSVAQTWYDHPGGEHPPLTDRRRIRPIGRKAGFRFSGCSVSCQDISAHGKPRRRGLRADSSGSGGGGGTSDANGTGGPTGPGGGPSGACTSETAPAGDALGVWDGKAATAGEVRGPCAVGSAFWTG